MFPLSASFPRCTAMAKSARRVARPGSVTAIVIAGALLAGCGSSSSSNDATPSTTRTNKGGSTSTSASDTTTGAAATPATAHVSIKDLQFGPKTLNVTSGTKVTWMNHDNETHTVTANPGDPVEFDAGNVKPGASVSVTFTKPGTYQYHCNIHTDMTATIVVS